MLELVWNPCFLCQKFVWKPCSLCQNWCENCILCQNWCENCILCRNWCENPYLLCQNFMSCLVQCRSRNVFKKEEEIFEKRSNFALTDAYPSCSTTAWRRASRGRQPPRSRCRREWRRPWAWLPTSRWRPSWRTNSSRTSPQVGGACFDWKCHALIRGVALISIITVVILFGVFWTRFWSLFVSNSGRADKLYYYYYYYRYSFFGVFWTRFWALFVSNSWGTDKLYYYYRNVWSTLNTVLDPV